MTMLRILGLWAMALALVYAAAPAAAQSSPPAMAPRPENSPAADASPEAVEAAKELVNIISASMITDLTNKVTAEAWPPIAASLRSRKPSIDAGTFAELRREFGRLMVTNIFEMMSRAPAIYAHYFTAQEIRDIVAFYRTPTGVKTLTVMPDVNAQVAGALLQDLPDMQQRIEQTFNNILRVHGYAQ
jgi:hypothetical protein